MADNCEVRAHLPELATTTAGASPLGAGLASSTVSPVSPYCHVAFGIQTQFRGLASYELPGIGVQLSATLQSKPGAMLAANYAVPNAAVAPSLGRNLSGNAPNVTVNLVAPGTMYGDRINELDVRVGQDPAARAVANDGCARHLQRVELERGPHLQQRVRPGRTVAAAQYHPDAALLQDYRRNRVLTWRAYADLATWRSASGRCWRWRSRRASSPLSRTRKKPTARSRYSS